MRKKAYGARQDSAWRQSVKDYSPSGGKVLHGERRRKATIAIIENSDQAPQGWSYITVGERWNGRGKYVDLFLQELAASPECREESWEVHYGDDGAERLCAIRMKLKEHRLVHRDKLQYSINLVLEYSGTACVLTRGMLREYAPGWYDTTVCRTEESRELGWQTLKRACERAKQQLRRHLCDWKANKERKIALMRINQEPGNVIGSASVFNGSATGSIADTEERFTLYWFIHHDVERPPSWEMFARPGSGSSSTMIQSAAEDPLQARQQIASFLAHLNVTRPAEFGGRRRIEG